MRQFARNWGPAFLVLMVFAAVGTALSQTPADPQRNRGVVASAWHIYSFDDDIDTAYEPVAELDAYSLAAISSLAMDKVEILSASSSDTDVDFRIEGIKPDSSRITYVGNLNGTSVVTTSDSLRLLESVRLVGGSDTQGAITVRDASGDATVTTLLAGQNQSYFAGKFVAKNERGYITDWSAMVTSTTGTISAQLRIYFNFNNTVDPTDGYIVADSCLLPATVGAEYRMQFPEPIEIPRYGWAVIYALGGANNSDVKVTMSGYNTR